MSDFDRAIALDANNARAFRERSNALRTVGRLDRALADANEAVQLDPNDAKVFDNRGNVFNNNRQYDRAIDDYDEAVRLDPKFGQAFMDRGVALLLQGRLRRRDRGLRCGHQARSEAFARLHQSRRRLQETWPRRAGAGRRKRSDKTRSAGAGIFRQSRPVSYQENGDYDRAIADYNEAIRLAPQANFLTNRGDSYQFKGDSTTPSPTTIARSSSIPAFIWPTTIAARPAQEGRS